MKPSFTEYDGIVLNDLPPEHPLRNRPLIEIGASYKYKTGGFGRHKLKAAWKIASNSFNDLGESWTNNAIWYSHLHDDTLSSPDAPVSKPSPES